MYLLIGSKPFIFLSKTVGCPDNIFKGFGCPNDTDVLDSSYKEMYFLQLYCIA